MAASTRVDRLLNAMDERADAMFSAVNENNDRVLRISKMVVEELHRTQRENSDLARYGLTRPSDVFGWSNAAVDTWARRGRRRVELVRTLASELGGIGSEARGTVRRVAEANREAARLAMEAGRDAAQATAAAGREAVVRASEEVAERAGEVSEKAQEMDGSARRRNNRSG